MIYKFESNGKKIEFEESKIYYIADKFPTQVGGKQYQWPIIVECICIETDPEDWDYEFQLKGVRNIIPSDFLATQYHHPGDLHYSDWDGYFFSTLEEAYRKFYKEYKFNPTRFFNIIFEEIQR